MTESNLPKDVKDDIKKLVIAMLNAAPDYSKMKDLITVTPLNTHDKKKLTRCKDCCFNLDGYCQRNPPSLWHYKTKNGGVISETGFPEINRILSPIKGCFSGEPKEGDDDAS